MLCRGLTPNSAHVTPATHRASIYWLLLLLPTLGVGIGAIVLLRREQARLTERAAYADEARRAAVTARARLIAENVELLVGDVQSGLLDLLATESPGGGDQQLDQLENSNPLVRAVFRCAPDGRVLRPTPHQTDDDGRGFLRRFGRTLTESPPWRSSVTNNLGAMASLNERQQQKQEDESLVRQEVTQNVAKVQSARRDVQALAKGDYANSSPAPSAYRSAEMQSGLSASEDKLKRAVLADQVVKDSPQSPASRGWLPLKVDGRLHLLGWVQAAGRGEVRGVELEMAALISRLGGALPAEFSSDEGYALRDEQGRVLHQAGAVSRADTSAFISKVSRFAEPAIRVPLAADLLPGWEVVAFLPVVDRNGSIGGGSFLIGSLLVGIFLVAIIAGGSLLLRQARQSEAEAAQKTSFVANVSHEFKTPLTTIRLYSELLEQGRVADEAKRGEYLRTIGRETQRLARLVGNALDFSRLEQGKKKYAHDALDLRAELSRLLDAQQPRLTEAGLVLRRDLPAESLAVTSDRDAFEQILLNLIDNAAKYGASGGEVTVQLATKPGGGAIIRVLDRGPGVPRDHWDRIFDKFHRVDDTLTAEKTGTGLGLSIARQLARGLGGELRHAPRDGGGAVFTLELP